MCLIKIWDLGDCCIFPKRLQSIEVAGLWLEDVDECIAVVNGNPLAVLHADLSLMTLAQMVTDEVGQSVGDTVDMNRGRSFADNEILERGFLELAHVDNLYVLSLAILKAFDDFFY